MPCYSPLKGYKDEETGGLKFRPDATKETMDVACGSCLGCRLDRSRMWAMRISHEATMYETGFGNSFVTLTYRDKSQCTKDQLDQKLYVPDNYGLSVPVRDHNGKQIKQSHFQAFMKRLRKHVSKADKDAGRKPRRIKYYQCGEYGETCRHGIKLSLVKCPLCNLGRPHHHAILFNYRPNDLRPYAQERDIVRNTSESLESLWRYGFVDVGEVTQQSAAYCARYIQKKITGKQAEDHYTGITDEGEINALAPEYSTMSNGIGKKYYEDYKSDFFPSDQTPIPGGKVVDGVPRYYTEMYKGSDPYDHEQLKENRLKHRRENADEYTPERLYSKYKIKKAATQTLKREL